MEVVVVLAHPSADSLNHAAAHRAEAALRAQGHTVHLLDLYELGVSAAMSEAERAAYHSDEPLLDPVLRQHANLISRAGALVFVYPTWWSSMPAILKGWLERVMVPGVAFRLDAAHKVRPGLTNVRRIVGISTYGSPRPYVKAINDNGRRTLKRALRLNTGLRTRARWVALYAVDTASAERRQAFLAEVEHRMPRAVKVLVVYCHPSEDSLVAAARDRVLAGLAAGGHEARLTDLYADGFRPELSEWERRHHLDPPDGKPEIAAYAADLRWCDALVLVYPTWWAGQPAMLKGWIDRVWVAGVVYELPEGANRIRPLLTNVRRIVAVTTHGSSKFVNALEGEGGKRVVTRALRVLCNRFARTKWIALYSVDRADAARRERFLDRVERSFTRLR